MQSYITQSNNNNKLTLFFFLLMIVSISSSIFLRPFLINNKIINPTNNKTMATIPLQHFTPSSPIPGIEGMPMIGYGVYQIPPPQTFDAVTSALKIGYRHIDTAQFYGNERAVGEAIRKSGIDRKEIWVTTKYFTPTKPAATPKGIFDETVEAIQKSVNELNIGYIDLFLLHSPHYPQAREPRWRALEAMVQKGLVRYIGVSNYGNHHIDELLSYAKIKPIVNQIEAHTFCLRPELVQHCQSKSIVVVAYSPLAKASNFSHPTLVSIAKATGKTPAQVMLKHMLQHGMVIIPKSTHENRMKENLALDDFMLSPQQMKELDALDKREVTGWDPTTSA
jgi:diketogulonate reductase-like aldo/keto reductase